MTTPFYQTKHWLVCLLLLAIVAGGLAWFQARSAVYEELENKGVVIPAGSESAYSRYVLGFAFVNALLGAVFFALWSFVVKGLSPNAKVTPVLIRVTATSSGSGSGSGRSIIDTVHGDPETTTSR